MRHEQQIILTTPLGLDKLIYHLIDIVAGNLGFFGYCQVVKQSLHRGIWLEQSFRAPPELKTDFSMLSFVDSGSGSPLLTACAGGKVKAWGEVSSHF